MAVNAFVIDEVTTARASSARVVGRMFGRDALVFGAVLFYVLLVFGVDLARANGRLPLLVASTLSQLGLTRTAAGFDWYKCVAWFVVPLALTGYTQGRQRVRLSLTRRELLVLAVVLLGSGLLMLVVANTSELSALYLADTRGSWRLRLDRAMWQIVWTLSWLPGYEVLVRSLLLSHAAPVLGAWSIALVAGVEFVYHLPKPWLEALGVLPFSVGLSYTAWRRPGSPFPLLAHACVEVVLIGFIALRA